MKKWDAVINIGYVGLFTYVVWPLDFWRYLAAFAILLFVDVYQYRKGTKVWA